MVPAPLPQSQSANRNQLFRTTTTCSVVRRAAPPIVYIVHGTSRLQRQAPAAHGIQSVYRLLNQHGQGRGPTAVTPDQEAEEEEEVSPALHRNH